MSFMLWRTSALAWRKGVWCPRWTPRLCPSQLRRRPAGGRKGDAKDAVFCNELIFKSAAATTRADCIDDEPGSSGAAPHEKKLRVAAERASEEGVPGDGPRGHQAPGKTRLQEEPQMTKRVSLPGHTDRSIVIGANLPPA